METAEVEKMGGKTSVPAQEKTEDYSYDGCLTGPTPDWWEVYFKGHSKLGETAHSVWSTGNRSQRPNIGIFV